MYSNECLIIMRRCSMYASLVVFINSLNMHGIRVELEICHNWGKIIVL
uniref:Uncharacterized protein n=1 Tax=Arundo donax TaxID=35708 RepID=A0A0A9AFB5_ARUDO